MTDNNQFQDRELLEKWLSLQERINSGDVDMNNPDYLEEIRNLRMQFQQANTILGNERAYTQEYDQAKIWEILKEKLALNEEDSKQMDDLLQQKYGGNVYKFIFEHFGDEIRNKLAQTGKKIDDFNDLL